MNSSVAGVCKGFFGGIIGWTTNGLILIHTKILQGRGRMIYLSPLSEQSLARLHENITEMQLVQSDG
jgi:hypothetical protein